MIPTFQPQIIKFEQNQNQNMSEMWTSNPYYSTGFANPPPPDFEDLTKSSQERAFLSPVYHTHETSAFLEPNKLMFSEDFTSLTEFDELPLLDELEIYPDRIFEKIQAVLNPFRTHSLADDSDFLTRETDLAGPITFYVFLAIVLLVSGSNAHFGYIYGLSLASCILMYCLLSLMTITNSIFTLFNVASILGYCLLPIVCLSVVRVFVALYGVLAVLFASSAVIWSSLSASRLFANMCGDSGKRVLIAYPCALVYAAYVLLILNQ